MLASASLTGTPPTQRVSAASCWSSSAVIGLLFCSSFGRSAWRMLIAAATAGACAAVIVPGAAYAATAPAARATIVSGAASATRRLVVGCGPEGIRGDHIGRGAGIGSAHGGTPEAPVPLAKCARRKRNSARRARSGRPRERRAAVVALDDVTRVVLGPLVLDGTVRARPPRRSAERMRPTLARPQSDSSRDRACDLDIRLSASMAGLR